MRPIVLPTGWTILLDIMGWFIIHMGVSWYISNAQPNRFYPSSWLYRRKGFETESLYRKVWKIGKWKAALPDAAHWFKGGFTKKNLRSTETSYLRRFEIETCRGELAHWITFLFSPLFFLWNPVWVGCFMLGYGMIMNLPCILVQRFNRLRLSKVLSQRCGVNS